MLKGPVPETFIDDWVRHHYVQPPGDGAAGYRDDIMVLTQRSGSSRSSSDPAVSDLLDGLFNAAYRRRILTVVRHGPRGAHDINARIAQRLRPILDPAAHPDNRLFNGALIMITRNDYARGLFNGDIGIVLRHGSDGAYQAFFRQTDRLSAFPAMGLPDWELAFAMTVHKSQGSEFEDACLILPDDSQHRLLTREVLYTAVTRASCRLIVCGTAPVFEAALGRTIHRTSGMMMPSPTKAD
jgi:exodeoxyribonuclease V alpha subunit